MPRFADPRVRHRRDRAIDVEDSGPLIAGIVIILLAVGLVRFAPNSVWGQELRRSYGVRPTGARGNFTRRDHLRAAGLSAVLAVVLELTSYATAAFGADTPDESTGSAIAFTYTIGAFLLAAMAMIATLRSLWKALRWRMELPDTPEHRRGLANAIDHLLDGQLSPEERADFLDVRYLQPHLEQIRRAVLALSSKHATGMPESFRSQIKEWTAGIRQSVE
jgi:hypothetical protein